MLPSFKQYLQTSESSDLESKVKNLVDGSGFIMFFEKKGDIYATDEQGRMVFAQMKNPSKELTDDWSDDATFMVTNLSNALRGGGVESVISKSDIRNMKIIDSEVASEKLLKQVKSSEPIDQKIQIISVKR